MNFHEYEIPLSPYDCYILIKGRWESWVDLHAIEGRSMETCVNQTSFLSFSVTFYVVRKEIHEILYVINKGCVLYIKYLLLIWTSFWCLKAYCDFSYCILLHHYWETLHQGKFSYSVKLKRLPNPFTLSLCKHVALKFVYNNDKYMLCLLFQFVVNVYVWWRMLASGHKVSTVLDNRLSQDITHMQALGRL